MRIIFFSITLLIYTAPVFAKSVGFRFAAPKPSLQCSQKLNWGVSMFPVPAKGDEIFDKMTLGRKAGQNATEPVIGVTATDGNFKVKKIQYGEVKEGIVFKNSNEPTVAIRTYEDSSYRCTIYEKNNGNDDLAVSSYVYEANGELRYYTRCEEMNPGIIRRNYLTCLSIKKASCSDFKADLIKKSKDPLRECGKNLDMTQYESIVSSFTNKPIEVLGIKNNSEQKSTVKGDAQISGQYNATDESPEMLDKERNVLTGFLSTVKAMIQKEPDRSLFSDFDDKSDSDVGSEKRSISEGLSNDLGQHFESVGGGYNIYYPHEWKNKGIIRGSTKPSPQQACRLIKAIENICNRLNDNQKQGASGATSGNSNGAAGQR